MNIRQIICPEQILEKIERKHAVSETEILSIFFRQPRIRFGEKGHTPGEDVYAAFSQILSGRYLAVFFVYKPSTSTAIVISARDMTNKERRRYGRK